LVLVWLCFATGGMLARLTLSLGTAGNRRGSCGLLSAGPTFFQRAGFAGEDGFDALQVWDVEPADGIVVVYRLNFFGTDALDKALFKCLCAPSRSRLQ
jgi:hypothetical protein